MKSKRLKIRNNEWLNGMSVIDAINWYEAHQRTHAGVIDILNSKGQLRDDWKELMSAAYDRECDDKNSYPS